MAKLEEMKEQAAEVRAQIARLTELLEDLNARIVEEEARTPLYTSDADAPTGQVRIAPPATARAAYQPSAPEEAPLMQQRHKYDDQTERDRKANQALDILDGLSKRK